MKPILTIIMYSLPAYLIVMFFLSQIFVPHLGWKRKPKHELPKEIQETLNKLVENNKTKKELLNAVIKYQTNNNKSSMMMLFLGFKDHFISDFDELWKTPFLHCHQQAYILRELLLKTKKFKETDIKIKITACYVQIHQYLEINVSETNKKEYVAVDPFAISLGYTIGETLPLLAFRDMKKRGIDWKKRYKEFKISKKSEKL